MPTLQIPNVPEPLYDRLRQRAESQNRSLSAEVVVLLDLALEQSDDEQVELLESIRRRRSIPSLRARQTARRC